MLHGSCLMAMGQRRRGVGRAPSAPHPASPNEPRVMNHQASSVKNQSSIMIENLDICIVIQIICQQIIFISILRELRFDHSYHLCFYSQYGSTTHICFVTNYHTTDVGALLTRQILIIFRCASSQILRFQMPDVRFV